MTEEDDEHEQQVEDDDGRRDDNSTSVRSKTNNHRLKRSIPNASTRRPSSPAFNGKQQTTKRSVTIDNNNNDLPSHVDEISATKRFKSDNCHVS
jgi:hypothetical protein